MLKLNVGFAKKIGEANYGSRGASVNLDLELEGGLVGDPDRLKQRIRQLFVLAKTAVDEELNGSATGGATGSAAAAVGTGQTNGNANGYGNSHGNAHAAGPRRATASQVRAIHAIGDRQRLDVAALLHERFGLRQAADLSISQASSMIDELKSVVPGGSR